MKMRDRCMEPCRSKVRKGGGVLLALVASAAMAAAQSPKPAAGQRISPALVESGQVEFIQNCAFCHGRDAGGGETGPDLTRSKVVADDVNGDKIGPVVRNGRPQNGMPAFNLTEQQIAGLVAFIHDRKIKAESENG